ncbi:MAG: amidohydrolase [Tenuifilaceae bacterium]
MKKRFSKSLIIISIILISLNMACSKRQKVDLIITNATIYTVDSAFSIANSMAISEELIIEVGSKEEVESKYISENIVDAEGKFIYPGLIDPHSHFLNYGVTLSRASLSGAKTWTEVVDRLVEHQKNFPTDWILGRGWNQNEWDIKEFPTNELLDKAFPDKPVLITRIDGHAAIANSVALRMANVDENSSISGGSLIKVNGKITGVLVDNAIELVRKIVPELDTKAKEQALNKAQENCFAVGLTSVSDAGLDLQDVLLIDSLQKSSQLKMRIYAMLNPTSDNFNYFLSKGIYTTTHLTVRSVKLFADGALGSRGALLLKPYSDDPKNKGLQLETTEKLTEYSGIAFKHGYQIITHCIGDAAVKLMLDIYSTYLETDNDLRWRIEHSQVIDPLDFNRFGEFNIVPSIQTTHATSDMTWADERLGERIKYAYAYQDLLKQNGWLPNGSDFPIESINPIYGFYAGVARKDLNGQPLEGFQMENALTREQALKAMTIWAAKANFEENEKGSLESGKWADFIILDRDLMKVPELDLPVSKVISTFVAGEQVYQNKP